MQCVTRDSLIFDLDGTLWDAAAASAAGWNAAAERLGIPERVTPEAIRTVSGKPTTECFQILLPELCPMPAEVARLFDACEREVVERQGGVLYEGVAAGVVRLAARHRLFVVSNCLDWYLEAFLRLSGLRECFAGWDCHGCSGAEKPAMLRRLKRRHNLADPVYVGDTLGDQQAAAGAGVGFAFARYGFGDVQGEPLCFDSFDQLVTHFLEA
jgi:phosphoglycolate phosphatase